MKAVKLSRVAGKQIEEAEALVGESLKIQEKIEEVLQSDPMPIVPRAWWEQSWWEQSTTTARKTELWVMAEL